MDKRKPNGDIYPVFMAIMRNDCVSVRVSEVDEDV